MKRIGSAHRSGTGWLLAAAVAWAIAPASTEAVIIFEKGKSAPLRGYLIDKNDVRVIVEELRPNGETSERILPLSGIDEMIIAVDAARLETLTPDKPEEYRDYAEELAEKREDPDARRTAIRLYLIAAYLQPQELGRSCLLGMTALARTAREEQEFRAMAYLLDPKHDPSLLSAPTTAAVDSRGLSEENRKLLLTFLRLVRTRRSTEARNLAKRADVRELLSQAVASIGPEELSAVIEEESLLSSPLLRRILDLEIALAGGGRPVAAGASDKPVRWAQVVAGGQLGPVAPLQLETLTQFDPRQQYFRNGKWVEAAVAEKKN